MRSGLDGVVSVDEIGISTARNGGLVLRSAYQYVFRQERDAMVAVAAEGFVRPFMEGVPVAPRGVLDALDPCERPFVERLCAALHMRNHIHSGGDGLDVMVTVDPGSASVLHLACDVAAARLDPARLVCSLRPPLPGNVAALAREARLLGARIAVTSEPDGSFPFDAIRRAAPDIVRIHGAWFRRICERDDALRLTARLVDGFRANGALVAVAGIETQRQLASALYLGVDLYQGHLFARPELAGMAADASPLPLSELFLDEAKVIPLRSRG